MARNPVFPSTDAKQPGRAAKPTRTADAAGASRNDAKAKREKRLGEALRANLRRRKAAARGAESAVAGNDAAARHEDGEP